MHQAHIQAAHLMFCIYQQLCNLQENSCTYSMCPNTYDYTFLHINQYRIHEFHETLGLNLFAY